MHLKTYAYYENVERKKKFRDLMRFSLNKSFDRVKKTIQKAEKVASATVSESRRSTVRFAESEDN